MIGNKYTGDSIALEFAKIMNKTAEVVNSNPEPVETDVSLVQDDHDSLVQVNAADFLVKKNKGGEDTKATQDIENKIMDLKESSDSNSKAKKNVHPKLSSAEFRRGKAVMGGLGKVAGSLRRRGEPFAADMVEATAKSIRFDLMKEAKKKNKVLTELDKIASELNKEGNEFASDLVKVTMNKILND